MRAAVCYSFVIVVSLFFTVDLWAADSGWQEKVCCQVPGPHLKGALYSPDGKNYVSIDDDVMLFDVATRKYLKCLETGTPGLPAAADFSSDGKLLSVLSILPESGSMIASIISFPDRKILKKIPVLNELDANVKKKISISPDKKKIAVSNRKGIAVYNIDTGKKTWDWAPDKKTNPNRSYSAFDVTPDWKYFLFNLQRVSYPAKQVTQPCAWSDKSKFFKLNIISPDGKKAFATGDSNGTVAKVFDLETGKVVSEGKSKFGSNALLCHPSGEMLISDQYIWNIPQNKFTDCRPYTNFDCIPALAYYPQKDELSIGNIYFKLSQADKLKKNKGDGHWLPENSSGIRVKAVFSPDSKSIYLLSNIMNNVINMETGESSDIGSRRGFRSSWVIVSPSGKFAAQRDHLLFPDKSKKAAVALEKPKQKLGFSPVPIFSNDDYVALVTSEGYAIYQPPSVKCIASHKTPNMRVGNKALSNGAIYLAVTADVANANKLIVYDVKTGKAILDKALKSRIHNYHLAFSNDSKILFSGIGRQISMYQLPSGEKVKSMTIKTGGIKTLAISPNGKWLLVHNANGRIEIFDIAKNTCFRVIAPGSIMKIYDVYAGDGTPICINRIDTSVPFGQKMSYKDCKLPANSAAGVVIAFIKAAAKQDMNAMKALTGKNNNGKSLSKRDLERTIRKAKKLKNFDSLEFWVYEPVNKIYRVVVNAEWRKNSFRKRTFYVSQKGDRFAVSKK